MYGCPFHRKGDLQERFSNIEAIVKQFVDGATEGRSICADVRYVSSYSVRTWHNFVIYSLPVLDSWIQLW